MFLGDLEIRQCLATGRLGIDPPPDESQLSAFAIELRLGTQFLKLPIGDQAMDALDPGRPWHMVPDRESLYAIELGDRVTISSGEVIMGTTLEYVHLPVDLAGFLFPKHALERVGLSLSTGTVDPGFQGRL